MKLKWVALVALIIAMFSGRITDGAITFSLAPNTPSNGEIPQGSSAVFDVFISSPTQQVIGGYSINVLAGPGNGSAGVFTSGTFDFLVGAPVQAWDVNSTPGRAFSTADTGSDGGTGVGNVLLANTPTRLGSLTLSTNGVALGQYQMSLTSLSAIQVNGLPISGSPTGAINGGPITYSIIAAVPEPSSILLSSMAAISILIGGIYRVWFRLPTPTSRSAN